MVSGEGLSAFKGTPVKQVWSHALVPHHRLTPRGAGTFLPALPPLVLQNRAGIAGPFTVSSDKVAEIPAQFFHLMRR